MSGNTIGRIFRSTTFGESHGPAMGVVVDGCPAGFALDLSLIRAELERRRPGQSKVVTQRQELDEFEVLSGLFEGKTTGAPLAFLVRNVDVKSKDYEALKDVFRPGHADFTYFAKYGWRDHRGGGRSSARETVARVIAGAIAKQLLAGVGIKFKGGVVQLGRVVAQQREWEQAEQSELRCVDSNVLEAMRAELEAARKDRDSVGAVVEVVVVGVPPGWGEPVFERLDAALAAAMLSIPAVKGFEVGAGFSAATKRGSELNDEMSSTRFKSNFHGGILGGISSGAPIVLRIALKPTSSIPQDKATINTAFTETLIATKGRHDPCVGIRAVPIAEAMAAIVLADFWLLQEAKQAVQSSYSAVKKIQYHQESE